MFSSIFILVQLAYGFRLFRSFCDLPLLDLDRMPLFWCRGTGDLLFSRILSSRLFASSIDDASLAGVLTSAVLCGKDSPVAACHASAANAEHGLVRDQAAAPALR